MLLNTFDGVHLSPSLCTPALLQCPAEATPSHTHTTAEWTCTLLNCLSTYECASHLLWVESSVPKSQQTISVKVQTANILGSAHHTVSVPIPQLSYCNTEAPWTIC